MAKHRVTRELFDLPFRVKRVKQDKFIIESVVIWLHASFIVILQTLS